MDRRRMKDRIATDLEPLRSQFDERQSVLTVAVRRQDEDSSSGDVVNEMKSELEINAARLRIRRGLNRELITIDHAIELERADENVMSEEEVYGFCARIKKESGPNIAVELRLKELLLEIPKDFLREALLQFELKDEESIAEFFTRNEGDNILMHDLLFFLDEGFLFGSFIDEEDFSEDEVVRATQSKYNRGVLTDPRLRKLLFQGNKLESKKLEVREDGSLTVVDPSKTFILLRYGHNDISVDPFLSQARFSDADIYHDETCFAFWDGHLFAFPNERVFDLASDQRSASWLAKYSMWSVHTQNNNVEFYQLAEIEEQG